jgi:hypothetical protein
MVYDGSMRFIFLLLAVHCFGSELGDRLSKAHPGDYLVAEGNERVVLLSIREVKEDRVVIEEISAKKLKHRPKSWPEWILARAPGHSSWTMVEFDLKTGKILEGFSFTKGSWLAPSSGPSFLSTLLHLNLEPLEGKDRKKIGPPPKEGEEDRRAVWNPLLFFEGKEIAHPKFDVYRSTWPEDGTELSGHTVLLYFDASRPSPLPQWIQVETAGATATIRSLDSGRNLPALHASMPRKVPEFVGSPLKKEGALCLKLKAPSYYTSFDLFAIDISGTSRQIFPMAHTLSKQGELLQIEIGEQELEGLEKGHRYNWLVVPSGYSEYYTESQKPFLWE